MEYAGRIVGSSSVEPSRLASTLAPSVSVSVSVSVSTSESANEAVERRGRTDGVRGPAVSACAGEFEPREEDSDTRPPYASKAPIVRVGADGTSVVVDGIADECGSGNVDVEEECEGRERV